MSRPLGPRREAEKLEAWYNCGFMNESIAESEEEPFPALGILGLEEGDLVVVDTAPLVYLIEGKEPRRRTAERFFGLARRGGLRLAISALAWTELLAAPLGRTDDELASRYRRFLADSRNLLVAPVDVAIAEKAAELLALSAPGRPLGLADALHLATAIVLGARAILSNDEDLVRARAALRKGPRILILDELAFDLGDDPGRAGANTQPHSDVRSSHD